MPALKFPGMPAEPGEASGGFTAYDGPIPPAGVYNGVVKFIKVKTNRNGDPMLNGVIEIDESDGSKKKYNGYGIWFNQNVTEQGAPYLNAFLVALGCTYKEFVGGKVSTDNDDPPKILRIGRLNLTGDNKIVVATKRSTYNGTERLEVSRYMPAKDEDVEEVEEIDEDVEDVADEADADEAEGYTRAELEEMTMAELRSILKEAGVAAETIKGMGRADMTDIILDSSSGTDEDAEDDDEGDDEPPF
jgi:hypothetical protein